MSGQYLLCNPQENESLLGFLRRLATLNAYPETSSFLARLNVRYGRPLIEELQSVSDQLGIPEKELSRLAPSAQPATPPLDWQFERGHSDPICPICCEEGRPHHVSWRHALVSACHVHGIRLQDSCPVCFEHRSPRNGSLETCSCGHSISKFPQEHAELHEVAVARLIAGDASGRINGVPGTLASELPVNVGRFVQFLASGFQQNRTGKEGKTATPKTVAETVALLKPVAPLLENWPHGFRGHVEERLAAGDQKLNSAPARLGNWYQRLMSFKEPAYQPYKVCVAEVIAQNFDGTYSGALSASQPRQWLTAKEAASEIGVSSQRLVEAVSNGQVLGKMANSGLGHRHTVVFVSEVEKIKANRSLFRDGRLVRDRLGVSRGQFDLLKGADVVKEVLKQDRPALVDGGFDVSVIDASVEFIRNSAQERDGDTIAFKDLSLRRTTDRAALVRLFKGIFAGEIRAVVAETGLVLAEFRFLETDVRRELRSGRHSLDWTAHDVAEITGWKPQCVTHWCKLGLLEARSVPHGRGAVFLISPASLARFQGEFVPVATLAKSRSSSSRKLLAEFAKHGIKTCGAESDGTTSRGHLVRLSDFGCAITALKPSSEPSRS